MRRYGYFLFFILGTSVFWGIGCSKYLFSQQSDASQSVTGGPAQQPTPPPVPTPVPVALLANNIVLFDVPSQPLWIPDSEIESFDSIPNPSTTTVNLVNAVSNQYGSVAPDTIQ